MSVPFFSSASLVGDGCLSRYKAKGVHLAGCCGSRLLILAWIAPYQRGWLTLLRGRTQTYTVQKRQPASTTQQEVAGLPANAAIGCDWRCLNSALNVHNEVTTIRLTLDTTDTYLLVSHTKFVASPYRHFPMTQAA